MDFFYSTVSIVRRPHPTTQATEPTEMNNVSALTFVCLPPQSWIFSSFLIHSLTILTSMENRGGIDP